MEDFDNDERETMELSKNLMQMKFMQRSVFRIEREQQEDEGREIDDEHWVLDLPELQQREVQFIKEPSLAVCASLRFGRVSSGGMNPIVEKLMRTMNAETEDQASAEKEEAIAVTDVEMAQRYESLMGTISNKFKTKRQRREEGGQAAEGRGVREDVADFLRQQRAAVEEGQQQEEEEEEQQQQQEPPPKRQKTGLKGRHFLKPSDV